MKLENRSTRIIRYLSLVLVFLLAVGAFAQSYAVLWDVALAYGLPPKMAWFWPLLVDGAIVVFSLAVVRNGLLGERTAWPWVLVILFTLGTIILNGIHSDGRYVSIAVAVVAPIALVLAFETSMAMLKSDVKRAGLVRSIAEIEQEAKEKREELDRWQHDQLEEIREQGQKAQLELDNQLGQLQGWIEAARLELATYREQAETMERTVQTYRQDIEARKEELKTLDSGQAKVYLPANLSVSQRQELVARMGQDGMTNEAIAGVLGVSIGTVKNDKKASKEANSNGPITDPADVPWTAGGKNGHRKG